MNRFHLVSLAAIAFTALSAQTVCAHPRGDWSIGVNFGAPLYRPWGYYPAYGPAYGYWRPYYYAPASVIYESAPVVIQPAPVYVPQRSVVVPARSTSAPDEPTSGAGQSRLEHHLQMLRSPEEAARRDAAMELGRMKAERALDPLTATLAGDQSPVVREAAARGLGLIGAPRSLTALIRAAQADADRDVRHSAQFAVEIIRSNLKK